MASPNVRLVDGLKIEAATYAANLGISLNALVAVAVREYLAARIAVPAAGTSQVQAPCPVPPPSSSPPRISHASMARMVHPSVPSKVGRNNPCPCGSGKKAKVCCPANC